MIKKKIILIIFVSCLIILSVDAFWDKRIYYMSSDLFYAEYWFDDASGTEINFAQQDLFYNLTFTNSKKRGFVNITNSSFEVQKSGKYLVNYMASGSGQNSHTYETTIGINNVYQENTKSFKNLVEGADIVTMSGTGILNLSEGDIITFSVRDTTGTGTGDYYSGNINLVRISS